MTTRATVPGWLGRAVDGLWLLALALYALAGYRDVPFHADEATIIAMSRDYHALVQSGDLDAVLYSATPDDPAMQALRIINGSVSKLAIGVAWDLAGHTVDDLNQPWDWSAPWSWNVQDNHMPSDGLLHAARLASALMLAASAWAVFAVGWLAAGGRWGAYAASVIYVLTPVVLVNGRRAMFEGALLLGSALVVLAAVWWLRAGLRPRWRHVVALGLAAGFALSSKHTAALTIGIVWAVLVALIAFDRRAAWRTSLGALIAALVLAGVVFLLLNPVWWSDPLGMPEHVLDGRQTLLSGQRATYGAYDGVGEHVAGLIRRVADGSPQYYEVAGWDRWIGADITAYESRAWTGIDGGVVGAFLRVVGLVIGTAVLLDRAVAPQRDAAAWLLLAWFWGTAAVLLALTPFDWQRYYLPLQPALAVVIAAAVARVGAWSSDDVRTRREG